MCIKNIVKIANQVTGSDFRYQELGSAIGYRLYSNKDEEYITVAYTLKNTFFFTIGEFENDAELEKAFKLIYPDSTIWMVRDARRKARDNKEI